MRWRLLTPCPTIYSLIHSNRPLTTDRYSEQLLDLLRQGGPLASAALQAALRVSQPTVSRLLADLGDQVARIGRARATRYALVRSIGRDGNRWPLYRIDPAGRPHRLGELRALHGGGFHLLAGRPWPALLHGEFASGLFPGLPWFLDDQRPQGFLGRLWAGRIAPLIGAPDDPRAWGEDDVILALLREGHDPPGDLVLGEAALRRALDSSTPALREDERESCYPALADAVLRGEPAGSSAAGEQPKFTTTRATAEGARPVIVKFSEAGEGATARRWADLLCCEHLAGETLRAQGVPAAPSALIDAAGRRFLESARFDRTPAGGRIGFVSLAAVDAAFHGHGRIDWWRYADQLHSEGWLDAADARRLRVLGWFGALIGNHDMHLGNAGLHLDERLPLRLAPAYDMLPMRFCPTATGEVVERVFRIPAPLPEYLADWRAAAAMALAFWQRAAEDLRISDPFRRMAAAATAETDQALRRYD